MALRTFGDGEYGGDGGDGEYGGDGGDGECGGDTGDEEYSGDGGDEEYGGAKPDVRTAGVFAKPDPSESGAGVFAKPDPSEFRCEPFVAGNVCNTQIAPGKKKGGWEEGRWVGFAKTVVLRPDPRDPRSAILEVLTMEPTELSQVEASSFGIVLFKAP